MTAAEVTFHCERALVDGTLLHDVRVRVVGGRTQELGVGVAAEPGDVALGLVVPGFANAHSHAFHRLLRGRTHAEGGTFWQWRTRMYDVARQLTPDSYRDLAETVFAEMRDAGYTAVGEFHYVHHDPRGKRYPGHAMEVALADAARSAGIRLVLLDTCYLRGGVRTTLAPEQQRFGDGDAHRWLERWHSLRTALAEVSSDLVTLGAAIHSVRAVSRDDLVTISDGLPPDVPLHVHLSEQPAENQDCLAAYGLTPTGLLAAHGLVDERLSAVHATHLTQDDIMLLGRARATVVMCPTTEADLGDGIGPAPELLEAGARLAIGSDQHAVIDPLEELSRLEMDQRLRLQRRGIFAPPVLWAAGTTNGYHSLGLVAEGSTPAWRPGDPFDAVEIDPNTARSANALPEQLVLAARAGDVTGTIVGGRLTRPPRERRACQAASAP